MTPEAAAAILNVEVGAGPDDVRAAYKLKSRMTHPDRFAGAQAKDLAHAQAEFVRVGIARDVLLDSRRRPSGPAEPQAQPAPQPPPSDSYRAAGRPQSSHKTGSYRPTRDPSFPGHTDPTRPASKPEQTNSPPTSDRPSTGTSIEQFRNCLRNSFARRQLGFTMMTDSEAEGIASDNTLLKSYYDKWTETRAT